MEGLDVQVHAFLVLVLAGIAAGVLFDVLRVLRRRLGRRDPLEVVLDLLFWGAVTAVLGAALLTGPRGTLRFYIPLALAAGIWLYFALASSLFSEGLAWLVGVLAWVAGGLAGGAARAVAVPLRAGATVLAAVWGVVAGALALALRPAGVAARRLGGAARRAARRAREWLLPPEGRPPEDGRPD